MALPDAQLVERTLGGDLEGFGELHRRYYKRVVSVVSRIMGDLLQAEDTVQNAYMTALEALPRLADPHRFYPWLCRIAVNQAIEEKRRQKRSSRLHSDWAGCGGGSGRRYGFRPESLREAHHRGEVPESSCGSGEPAGGNARCHRASIFRWVVDAGGGRSTGV